MLHALHFYLEDPFSQDQGAVYIDEINYNNEQKRKIAFTYEADTRPDRRLVFEQGNILEESRRLADISVYANNSFGNVGTNSSGFTLDFDKKYSENFNTIFHQLKSDNKEMKEDANYQFYYYSKIILKILI